MTYRIQAQPNPAYLKSDGTLNALGQIKTYEAGTSTPKIVFKDASGTSYGSTIDLDSAGLPDEGPIYWDDTEAYKVEVYTRVDNTPTYALDYTVDNYGGLYTTVVDSSITTALAWTVDGVGGTETTFTTLSSAMEAARELWFSGTGSLTITVENGTYTNEDIDFYHSQGENISIVGESEAGVIYRRTDAADTVFEISSKLARLSKMTIDCDSSALVAMGIRVFGGAIIRDLSDVTIDLVGHVGSGYGLRITNAQVKNGPLTITGALYGILLEHGTLDSEVDGLTGAGIATITFDASCTTALLAAINSHFYGEVYIDGAGAGVEAANRSYCRVIYSTLQNISGTAFSVGNMASIEALAPTLSGNGADYSQALNVLPGTASATDTAIIVS